MVRFSDGTEGEARPWVFAWHPEMLRGAPALAPSLRPPRATRQPRTTVNMGFKWIEGGGGEQFVRYAWLPEAQEPKVSMKEARARGGTTFPRTWSDASLAARSGSRSSYSWLRREMSWRTRAPLAEGPPAGAGRFAGAHRARHGSRNWR